MLQSWIDDGELAGLVARVQVNGAPVYERAFGWADREADRRMTLDTIFRIASQTKAITAAAALVLIEAGLLGLDDPVSRHLPDFTPTSVAGIQSGSPARVPVRRPITVRDLLAHTAGLSYGTEPQVASEYAAAGLGPAAGPGWYLADKDEPVCQTISRLGRLPLVAQPGERFVYGYSTDVLGCLIEAVSGRPLDAFVRERITGPLGMTDTTFFLDAARASRLAAVHVAGADGQVRRAGGSPVGQGAYVNGPRRNFSGGAGLLSTAADYARFAEMLRRGGELDGVRILSAESVRLMTTNQVGSMHTHIGLGFGFGVQTTDRAGAHGPDRVGAYGWGGAYGTYFRVDPEAGVVILLLTQTLADHLARIETFSTMAYRTFVR
ncbi:MAG TPA: serine hydrolase domain-containing protein [Vicinamibacterales bacterium]|nr:serine hydrolase domain-containing protein [Vicinamibacterales bacterium]